MTTHLRRLGLVLAAAVLLAGCGRSGASEAAGTPGKDVEVLELASIPAEILGLTVQQEEVTETVARVESTFIDGLALYSLRTASSGETGDLVQATLQVSRFNDAADPDSAEFRRTVVNQIGSSKPRAFRLGSRTVHLTTGTKQSIAVWFSGRHMFVLASRSDYDRPRTLLRQVLELDL